MQDTPAKPVTGNKTPPDAPAGEETLPDMIAQLVPPPEPPAISMWPVTPFAKGLGALLLLLLLFFIWRQLQIYRANAYRRAALAELQQTGDDPAQVAEILRRTALGAYPRTQVAALTGDEWLAFLNQHYPGDAFAGEVGRTLLQSPYARTVPTQSRALAEAARDWIRRHKVTRPTLLASYLSNRAMEASP
ncbi:DUF4381 domain-containing protein [Microbulbifer aggregans]|uniref:DUF4381 domain-containing protein n=1 Tax=Microbulbifer aggregans TaxID=1769779 RepID=UPI001CFF28F8|nr:DUF4381 domain-containing protein [Microbulbifer aggregans]